MKADSGESVTVTIGKIPPMFEALEIVKVNSGNYSLTYLVENKSGGRHTLSLRPLNTSRWKLIRYFELKILRKLLKSNNHE